MAIILIANAESTEDVNQFLLSVYGGRRKMKLGNSAKKCENSGETLKENDDDSTENAVLHVLLSSNFLNQ